MHQEQRVLSRYSTNMCLAVQHKHGRTRIRVSSTSISWYAGSECIAQVKEYWEPGVQHKYRYTEVRVSSTDIGVLGTGCLAQYVYQGQSVQQKQRIAENRVSSTSVGIMGSKCLQNRYRSTWDQGVQHRYSSTGNRCLYYTYKVWKTGCLSEVKLGAKSVLAQDYNTWNKVPQSKIEIGLWNCMGVLAQGKEYTRSGVSSTKR